MSWPWLSTSAALMITSGASLMVLAACAGPGPVVQAVALPVPPAPVPGRWVQVQTGSETRFHYCIEPACPTPSQPQPVAPVVAAAPPPVWLALAHLAEAAAPKAPASQQYQLPFATNSARLSRAALLQLEQLRPQLAAAARIEIHGRTDASGSAQANSRLASARAAAVADWLRREIPALPPLTVAAAGACCFVAANDTADGRQANRRVELHLFPSSAPVAASLTPTRSTP